MNAFHPDYMKTFYPNFWGNAAAQAKKSQLMTDIVANTRKTKPSHGTISGFSKNRVSLKPLQFLIYSRA
jgi:hypothetical protein